MLAAQAYRGGQVMKRISTKKLTLTAILVSCAMILSYIEVLLPIPLPIPGIKLGLANIATLFALYSLGAGYATAITLLRVFLSALLFGNVASLIYSLAGGILALFFMITLKRLDAFSSIGVSVAGAVAHNAGQILAAAIIMKTAGIASYLPVLAITGTVAGVLIGIASGILIERTGKYVKEINRKH